MVSREIYLDLDGVCVDFIRPAIDAHGYDTDAVMARWEANHPGEFYPDKALAMEMERFWDHLATLGESFWANLQPYPWFEDLYARLDELGHVVFCTSSTRAPACVAGKLRWLQDRFGADFQDYILTAHKDRLAHANAFLIDDFDQNVARFASRGGVGVLFPQFWNSNHHVRVDPVDYVLQKIA
jgi:5'(3')-deoxyribonucleotidase